MGKIKPQVNKLSQGEADTISNFVKWGLDVIVKLTGGKPTFGDKKQDYFLLIISVPISIGTLMIQNIKSIITIVSEYER